jgi:hypothetical protein
LKLKFSTNYGGINKDGVKNIQKFKITYQVFNVGYTQTLGAIAYDDFQIINNILFNSLAYYYSVLNAKSSFSVLLWFPVTKK